MMTSEDIYWINGLPSKKSMNQIIDEHRVDVNLNERWGKNKEASGFLWWTGRHMNDKIQDFIKHLNAMEIRTGALTMYDHSSLLHGSVEVYNKNV